MRIADSRPIHILQSPYLCNYLEINLLTQYNIIMSKALKILTAAVDILLLIDIASDLVRKYRERKAENNNIVSPETEEEPVVEEA